MIELLGVANDSCSSSGVAKGGQWGQLRPLAENPELHSRLTGVAGIAIKYSTKVHNVTTAALNNM